MSIILKTESHISSSTKPSSGSVNLFYLSNSNSLYYKIGNTLETVYSFGNFYSASNISSDTNTIQVFSGTNIINNIRNLQFYTLTGISGTSLNLSNSIVLITSSNTILSFTASNTGSGETIVENVSLNNNTRISTLNFNKITGSGGTTVTLSGSTYVIATNTFTAGASNYYITPDPTFFSSATFTTPDSTAHSSAWPISGVVYLFGTYNPVTNVGTSKVLYATMSNPTSWSQVSGVIDFFQGEHQAIIGNKIYHFGGWNNATIPHSTIYSASVENPLSWSNTGASLPANITQCTLYVSKETGKIILYGGHLSGGVNQNTIFTASISNPLVWGTAPTTLPAANSSIARIEAGDWIYLYGGYGSLNAIWRAHKTTPTVVSDSGFTLTRSLVQPCQPIQIGNYVYIFSNVNSNGTFRIDVNKPWAPEFISGAMCIPAALTSKNPVFMAQNKIFHMAGFPTAAIHTSSYYITGSQIRNSSLSYGSDVSVNLASGEFTTYSSIEKFGASTIWQSDIDR